ncbi:two-component system response regulator CreB [Acanthopleuribacter pedis]|uniref:Two-component system response regulator CreB n=1 Tax=Acanthopleuribacter pedis TaxID=442870 RepID=A0A8J7QL37_9BACT|nr:two-component system response regulator CreB [Acanthopleuribacter pedis]MBO1319960.1 two-component system response regulator CreB [Acanthopleuribacter pedis]
MSKHILVIEDEPAIADTITYALETEGFRCTWCGTASAGQETLAEQAVDLIVLDVGLPDLNGFELCKRIRKTQTVPIIFLTARADEIDRVVGLEIGADDYVVKPFSPRELAARVKAVLRRYAAVEARRDEAPEPKAPAEPEKRNSPRFQIDEARMTILYFGSRLQLSRYEYRLLKILVQRPGMVFTRDQLMDLAWDEPEASMDRTVDAHIKSLRAKLKAVRPDEHPINTIRGVGYALKEQDAVS